MLSVSDVSGINAAEVGLVLSYAGMSLYWMTVLCDAADSVTAQLTQQTGMLTRQSAEVENYMNSVEVGSLSWFCRP
jgi:hypothetical protein